MISESQVTIGVELEMLVSNIPRDAPVYAEYKLVSDALVPVGTKFGVPVIDTASNYSLRQGDKELMSAFHVQSETSILTDHDQRAVEVATPILRNGQWTTVIPEMCSALQEALTLAYTPDTGLHVHIGIGRPYTLQELRRVAKAIIIFETQIDKCHPECRKGEIYSGHTNYIKSNRRNRVFKNMSDLECMKEIDSRDAIDDLLCAINCNPEEDYPKVSSRYYKYNVDSVRHLGTIEFRQAMGTDDEHEILLWIRRVIQFVISATSTDDSLFDEWARDGINDVNVYIDFGVPAPRAKTPPQPEPSPLPPPLVSRLQRRSTISIGHPISEQRARLPTRIHSLPGVGIARASTQPNTTNEEADTTPADNLGSPAHVRRRDRLRIFVRSKFTFSKNEYRKE